MPTITQTVAGATQFDGTAGKGRFSFAEHDLEPWTTRIVINRISYHSAIPGGGGSGGTRVDYKYQDFFGGITDQILIGRGIAPNITGPDGDVDFGVCGGYVPRRPGLPSSGGADAKHYQLICTSIGKTVDATISVDYTVEPHPSSSPEDPI